MKIINLVSDTVTKPSAQMLEAMMKAEVGDDVFKEDPTAEALQAYAANLFGKEKALFCPSGTMTNQLAIKTHTSPMDEVICDKDSHIYHYENGGYAWHSGVAIQLIDGTNGIINADQIKAAIKPVHDWLPISKLVVLENTSNRGGGGYYTLDQIKPIRRLCTEKGLRLHLDGARLFNALIESGESTAEWGQEFDSISICLSKGLGAPVGSLLIGDTDFIAKARRFRKGMGGGMRQVGYLAAAGLFALQNNVQRLKNDHIRAKSLADLLSSKTFVAKILPVKTNILIFDLVDGIDAATFLGLLADKGVKASAFGPQTVRMVTHLDFTGQDLVRTLDIIDQMNIGF